MPLRYIRRTLTAENVLNVAVTTSEVAREIADSMQFPPARAAAGILLLIFKTIQEIQENRAECYRLANRCLMLLTDIRHAMDGRWEDAPSSLLRGITTFEQTLQSIHDDLKKFADHKWRKRLTKKTSIKTAIGRYNAQLDDAARSFHITTLISIHYAIGDRSGEGGPARECQGDSAFATVTAVDALCESPKSGSAGPSFDTEHSLSMSEHSLPEGFSLVSEPSTHSMISEIADVPPAAKLTDSTMPRKEWIDEVLSEHDDRGFRRYHQSEVQRKSTRSRIKSGWWAGAQEVTVEGRNLVMLPYEGTNIVAAKRWIRDVKTLQNVYHPNLPQMVGYSGTDAPTPFILLANVQTRLPQAMILEAIDNGSLLSCARLMIRSYRDIFDSALYLQRQLDLTESKLQDFVENASYRIDGQDTMVMGLPPLEVDGWMSARNYGLTHSIRGIFMKLLPDSGDVRMPYDSKKSGSIDVQSKSNHLAMLTKALLPSSGERAVVSQRLDDMLRDEGEDEDEQGEELTLALIRMKAISSNAHEFTWYNNSVPAYKFTVGDLGYIPDGDDFTSFVLLTNILKDGLAYIDTVQSTHGTQSSMGSHFHRQELQSFPVAYGFTGWPVLTLPGARDNVQIVYECAFASMGAAWRLLLERGKSLADKYDVKPQELMLVTHSGVDARFQLVDARSQFASAMHPQYSQLHPQYPQVHSSPFGAQPFGGHGHHRMHFGPPQLQPALSYLFTSPEQDEDAVLSESPVYVPLPPGAPHPRVRDRFCSNYGTYGFVSYVQLHAEDFASS